MDKNIDETFSPCKYKELDGLRGVAAVVVFLSHILKINSDISFWNIFAAGTIGIIFNGHAAVQLFFVLSGFVLSLPYLDQTKDLNLTNFYAKRILRIYPAYLFTLLLSVILKNVVFNAAALNNPSYFIQNSYFPIGFWNWHWDFNHLKEILKMFFLIGPVFSSGLLDPPIWSLVIEMKMSLILPFLIKIVMRSSVISNIFLLVIFISITYKYSTAPIAIFLIGVLLAKYKEELLRLLNKLRSLNVILLFITALCLFNSNLIFHSFRKLNMDLSLFYNYMISIGSAVIIISIIAFKKIASVFKIGVIEFLGNISYSFYLIHFPIMFTVISLISRVVPFGIACIYLSSFLATVVLGYLINVSIERPFQKSAKYLTCKYRLFNILPV